MRITHALIKKFLENRCNAAEATAVAKYLKRHPELMAMHVRSSWDEAGKDDDLPPGYTEEIWAVINTQVGKNTRVVRFRWLAVAASFLMLVTAVWLYRSATRLPKQTLAATTGKQLADSSSWKQHINTSGKTYRIKLHDGSVVTLAPKAVIRYQEPFEKNKRDIYMEGEADFEVAHDKTRPFTVHAKLFSTTALGTSFRVSENAAGCNIKLFTGKVIIKALVNALKGWKQDVVLLPGNQMKYNLAKGAVSIEQFNTVPKLHDRQKKTAEENKEEKDKIIFDNTLLSNVMKTLMKKYHTPIEYEEALLHGKYFSGEVLKGDSLSLILTVIANMNELQVTKNDNGFVIGKSR